MQKSNKNKTLHNYHDKAIYRPSYIRRLLPKNHAAKEVEEEHWIYSPAQIRRVSEEVLLGITDDDSVHEEDVREEASGSSAYDIMKSMMQQGLAAATGGSASSSRRPLGKQALSSSSSGGFKPRPEPVPTGSVAEFCRRDSPRAQQLPRAEAAGGRYGVQRVPSRSRSRRGPGHGGYVRGPTPQDRDRRSETAPPTPPKKVNRERGRGDNISSDRNRLMCAAPNCYFLVHSDPAFGGYCCRKCHWRFDNQSKSKKKHGELCEQRAAPANAVKAEAIPPDDPM